MFLTCITPRGGNLGWVRRANPFSLPKTGGRGLGFSTHNALRPTPFRPVKKNELARKRARLAQPVCFFFSLTITNHSLSNLSIRVRSSLTHFL